MAHAYSLILFIAAIGLSACQKTTWSSQPAPQTAPGRPFGPAFQPPPQTVVPQRPVIQPPQPQMVIPQTSPPRVSQPEPLMPPRRTVTAPPPQPVIDTEPVIRPRSGTTQVTPPPVRVQPKVIEWYEPKEQPRAVVVEPKAPPQVIQLPPPKASELCHENQPCPKEPTPGMCKTVPLTVDKPSPKLDVLFLLDTSASLRNGPKGSKTGGELVQLAREMRNFVKRLDPRTDYRIGVLLAHGPKSSHHGKLFSSGRGDPVVLGFNQVLAAEKAKGGSEAEIHERVDQRLAQLLELKLLNVPNDSSDAQGEALLYSLYTAMTSGFENIRKQGLFRNDATVSIIAMTDEQDVCFAYEGTPYKPVMKKTVVKGRRAKKGQPAEADKVVEGPDPNEIRFFNEVCSKAVDGGPLKPEHVYKALQERETEARKILFNAVVYTTPNIPAGVEDENEMGHGILDLRRLMASGATADLANVDRSNNSVSFAKEMQLLGDVTAFQMRYHSLFKCASNTHPAAVNGSTVELKILDAQGRQVALYSGSCQPKTACAKGDGAVISRMVVNRKGQPYLEFTVDDSERFAEIMKAKGVDKGTVEIKFLTKTDVDPTTGDIIRRN